MNTCTLHLNLLHMSSVPSPRPSPTQHRTPFQAYLPFPSPHRPGTQHAAVLLQADKDTHPAAFTAPHMNPPPPSPTKTTCAATLTKGLATPLCGACARQRRWCCAPCSSSARGTRSGAQHHQRCFVQGPKGSTQGPPHKRQSPACMPHPCPALHTVCHMHPACWHTCAPGGSEQTLLLPHTHLCYARCTPVPTSCPANLPCLARAALPCQVGPNWPPYGPPPNTPSYLCCLLMAGNIVPIAWALRRVAMQVLCSWVHLCTVEAHFAKVNPGAQHQHGFFVQGL
jgi:hypothetical protein